MKSWALSGFICAALVPLCQAASVFMSPRQTSLVGQATKQVNKEMPKTEHDKEPGGGYKKGSPLYEKQQELKKAGPPKKPDTPTESPVDGADLTDWEKEAEYITHPHRSPYYLSWAGVRYFLGYLITWLLLALLWQYCGIFSWRSQKGYLERKSEYSGFSYGLFSLDHCYKGGDHHVNVCLCSWCCAPLRIADTWSKEPFAVMTRNFYVTLIVVCLLLGLGPWSGNLSLFIFFCVAVIMRQKMRQQYGMEHGNCSTYFQDCFTWWCCPCCAIAQEARQAEFCIKEKDPNPDTNQH